MAARIPKNADLADLLDGWAKYYHDRGNPGSALVMRKSASEIRRLRSVADQLRGARLGLLRALHDRPLPRRKPR